MKIKKNIMMKYLVIGISLILLCILLNYLDFSIYLDENIEKRGEFEKFREMHIDEECMKRVKEISKNKNIDYIQIITSNMLLNNYSLENLSEKKLLHNTKKMKKWRTSKKYKELNDYYKMVLLDLKYFPVPTNEDKKIDVNFENSWKLPRDYGGKRFHEGTDIIPANNERGYYKIISVTNGIVSNIGWLDKGGYRIGITGDNGGYFYYAHLFKYKTGIKKGSRVKAGDIIGFMGDSGYGKEGTIGKFVVHLHFGIYLNETCNEFSVNPYWILKYLENKKISFNY